MKHFFFLILVLSLFSCKTDPANLPAFSESKQVQVVIETPAGSAHKQQYNPEKQQFEKVQEAGQNKLIRFLPYPVNAGFIPSTREPKMDGNSGAPLRVLVIAESQPAGTVTEVMPLGVIILETANELHYEIIATPAKPSERLIAATAYEDLSEDNKHVKRILETWLVNHDPTLNTRIMGWKDDRFADELIRKWMK